MAKTKPEAAKGPKRDKRGTPYYDVWGHDPRTDGGRHICRVAAYSDPIIDEADGIQRLLDYLPVFTQELEKGKWGGFVFDSVSFAALSARKYHQYSLNPDTTNPLQWHGGGVDLIEELACMQLPALPCHVGAAFHIHVRKTDEGDGKSKSVRQPYVPGRRLEETKMVAAAWPELYRLYPQTKEINGEKKRLRYLQTETSTTFQAGTCIGLPDGVRVPKVLPADFMWQGWKGQGTRPEIHIGLYADPHMGKSTFFAQVFSQLSPDKPFYVAVFDARGKDMAYRLLGEVR